MKNMPTVTDNEELTIRLKTMISSSLALLTLVYDPPPKLWLAFALESH